MPTPAVFWDRTEAGRLLAEQLTAYAGRTDVVVLALPRGGVPVAYEVARTLGAPLDVLTGWKLGVAGHAKLAAEAIDDRPAPLVRGRTVILVDDGRAAGAMIRASVFALHRLGADCIIVAVPTAAPTPWEEFRQAADECVCAFTPEPRYVIGGWDEDGSQTTDDAVRAFLERAESQSRR
jgi:predicted phosphoribosyltransferase